MKLSIFIAYVSHFSSFTSLFQEAKNRRCLYIVKNIKDRQIIEQLMTPFAISSCSVSLSCMFCKDSDNSGQRSGTGTFSSSLYSVSHTGSCILVAKDLEGRSSVELFYHMKCQEDVKKLVNYSVKLRLAYPFGLLTL